MPSFLSENGLRDLELMLAPLRRFPEISGISSDLDVYLSEPAEPLEVRIQLELDRNEPGIDFARQLLLLVHRWAISNGVVMPPGVLLLARRLLWHGETVAGGWANPPSTNELPATRS